MSEQHIWGNHPFPVRQRYAKVLEDARLSIGKGEAWLEQDPVSFSFSNDVEAFFLLRAIAAGKVVSEPAFVVELVERYLKSMFALNPDDVLDREEMLVMTAGEIQTELNLYSSAKTLKAFVNC